MSEAIPRLVTPPALSSNSDDHDLGVSNIAGPSRLALNTSTQDANVKDALSARLEAASTSMGLKVRKRPAKLALHSSATTKGDTLQVRDFVVSSKSVPSSPVVYTMQGKTTASADTQLRDSLRGTPRRRPSVPFGLRM